MSLRERVNRSIRKFSEDYEDINEGQQWPINSKDNENNDDSRWNCYFFYTPNIQFVRTRVLRILKERSHCYFHSDENTRIDEIQI
mgnify:CR=1 FL=1